MAITTATLTFFYCLTAILLTHCLAETLRTNPSIARGLEKLAGLVLIGFGIKHAVSRLT
jgi:threonine/homoserine/homoserine lactone efflux protein